MKETFSFIDLFAGIGGFKMALHANGGNCIGFSEINKDAIATYCENYNVPPSYNLGNITKIKELPRHDILTAGVPCQSWSIAGKNLGFDDDRGQLWNDTIFLLNQSRPKVFIFENVKGLVDPRNKKALFYILDRIKEAGYFANYFVINSHDYGVAQNRIRIYIIGFKEKKYFDQFNLPPFNQNKKSLSEILSLNIQEDLSKEITQKDLFDSVVLPKQMSLSSKNGFNDYFLFNDLRNGHTTIHSWDITDTTPRQKEICLLLLKNRRKSRFGPLDGNPLSLNHFQSLDSTICKSELEGLVDLKILKKINYKYEIFEFLESELSEQESELLNFTTGNQLTINDLKTKRDLKVKKISITETINTLLQKGLLKCIEERYDFKNTKISSGLNGVNRIFLPSSNVFPTLVASDTNDYIALENITPTNHDNYKKQFLEKIYFPKRYRKITKEEACIIQGFPKDFTLPNSRARWMKLIGNSVSVPIIDILIKAIISTKVFDNYPNDEILNNKKISTEQTYS